jgi:hypothetical protein
MARSKNMDSMSERGISYLYTGTGNPWPGHKVTTLPPAMISLTSIVLLVTLGRTAPFGSENRVLCSIHSRVKERIDAGSVTRAVCRPPALHGWQTVGWWYTKGGSCCGDGQRENLRRFFQCLVYTLKALKFYTVKCQWVNSISVFQCTERSNCR